ncbi:MAG: Uncharacterised protein [Crocinitomicaceae bacterium]|nr:MAG: Uncharacterised protein [Crocinitomicaceae bacterium]
MYKGCGQLGMAIISKLSIIASLSSGSSTAPSEAHIAN